jgi:pyridoxine 5-phosphate synthase
VANRESVERAIAKLRAVHIHVSLFIDPDPRQIETAKLLGAQAVELQTATYSEARGERAAAVARTALEEATQFAVAQGLHVHMGHGLNYVNVRPVCRIPGVEELNIGHSIVARAVLVGMKQAVADMKEAIASATKS